MKQLNRAIVVYCAGGMKSGWANKLKEQLKGQGFIFINPADHGAKEEDEYTRWDLTGVEVADVLLGYMEAGNPGGSGLAVEFGWGAKSGKHLILLEDDEYAQKRYFGMVRAMCDHVVPVSPGLWLDNAVAQLEQFKRSFDRQLG